uniref:Uncharacterized protein n=1 Tax=Nicotiana tabacum TaxID=4097 RepID=A0A1S4AUF6_TOBAC|nr:PREDICTED: uncharacterized protein LOC107801497 [Nicotiana tabacum]
MAFTNKQYLISLMILMVALQVQYICSDCLLLSGHSHGKTATQHSRKLLYMLKEKETEPITVTGSEITKQGHGYGKTISTGNNGKNNKLELGVELREAPASPDPLHHHGNKPGIMP